MSQVELAKNSIGFCNGVENKRGGGHHNHRPYGHLTKENQLSATAPATQG